MIKNHRFWLIMRTLAEILAVVGAHRGKERSTTVFAIVISKSKVCRHAFLELGMFWLAISYLKSTYTSSTLRPARFQLKQAIVQPEP